MRNRCFADQLRGRAGSVSEPDSTYLNAASLRAAALLGGTRAAVVDLWVGASSDVRTRLLLTFDELRGDKY
jgi:hypothetical protein